jgi:hypothetical protein
MMNRKLNWFPTYLASKLNRPGEYDDVAPWIPLIGSLACSSWTSPSRLAGHGRLSEGGVDILTPKSMRISFSLNAFGGSRIKRMVI